MLECERIDVSEVIVINKTDDSPEYKNFKFQTCLCNGCHNLLQNHVGFVETAVITVKKMIMELVFWV